MVKRIECDLKFESKDIFFVTFQQNKLPAIKPCMSRGLLIFSHPVLSHPVGNTSGRMTVLSGITDGLV
jgi:hypothetical protein